MEWNENDHPRDDGGRFTDGNNWVTSKRDYSNICLEAYESKLSKSIREKESANKSEKFEHLTVFDDNGDIILEMDGEERQINVTQYLDKLKDKIVTHNHPDKTTTLSPSDIRVLVKSKMKEMRATDTEGGVHIMRRLDTPTGLENDFFYAADNANIIFQKTVIKTLGLESAINQGSQEAWKVVCDICAPVMAAWYKENSMKFGYEYEYKQGE